MNLPENGRREWNKPNGICCSIKLLGKMKNVSFIFT